jgi:lipocalin
MFLLLLAASAAVVSAQVKELNRTAYLGRFYQMYGDAFVDLTFENSSYCSTADYGVYPNNTISVWNRERQFNTSGPERQIFGWASVDDPSQPGELTVHLETTEFPAPYWVYQLGPIVDGKYDYSIVSDPLKLSLFVLARNVSRFNALYDRNVTAYLAAQGFNGLLNTPIPVGQEGCKYWDE